MKTIQNHNIKLMLKYLNYTFPKVNRCIRNYSSLFEKCKSTDSRRFDDFRPLDRLHAYGGSIFALYPGVNIKKGVKFIVTFQAICDYLDAFCEKTEIQDESQLKSLYLSMIDAVEPTRFSTGNNLSLSQKGDHEYLIHLIKECRSQAEHLPSYEIVLPYIKKYLKLYIDAKILSHLPLRIRQERFISWANRFAYKYTDISCWEFSAAASSTMGIFMMYALAWTPFISQDTIENIENAYFPWISGLKTLLQHYVNSIEDMQYGKLNFTYFYDNLKGCEDRLAYFYEQSVEHCKTVRCPEFHDIVIRTLLATYLTDPKAFFAMNRLSSSNLITKSNPGMTSYYRLYKLMRFAGRI